MERRTSVVVGANRGIGLELVSQLLDRGDRVIGTARDLSSARDLAELGPAAILRLDVGDERSIESFGMDLTATVDSVDLLINNAGVNSGAFDHEGPAGVLDMPGSVLLQVAQVNAVGPMLVTRAAMPLLEAASAAWVVNISSQLGSMADGHAHGPDVAYNVSKAALNMITVRTASELESRGVSCVALHPGWVRTDMGGSAAPIGVTESVSGMVSLIEKLGPDDNGGFYRWDGSSQTW